MTAGNACLTTSLQSAVRDVARLVNCIPGIHSLEADAISCARFLSPNLLLEIKTLVLIVLEEIIIYSSATTTRSLEKAIISLRPIALQLTSGHAGSPELLKQILVHPENGSWSIRGLWLGFSRTAEKIKPRSFAGLCDPQSPPNLEVLLLVQG